MTRAGVQIVIIGLLIGGSASCTHSDPFTPPPLSTQPPFSTGSMVQITFNVDQDYWPSWNGDGKGILYAYVDRENPRHRCLGMLAPEGGTRLWQLCDNRAIRDDSLSSFAAFAMDTAGQLLVAEAVSPAGSSASEIPRVTLWLADTAHPYVRQALLVLPVTIGSTPVTWLSELAWTGPNSFIVLGQQFNTVPHCVTAELLPPNRPDVATVCATRDTIWTDAGGVVLRGTISNGHATLEAVAGTEGATSFSLAEGGTRIVFTMSFRRQLFSVPATGGTPSPAPGPPAPDGIQFAGVSCKGSTCIAAKDAIGPAHSTIGSYSPAHYFWDQNPLRPPYTIPVGLMELHRISLASGSDEVLAANNSHLVYATPQISPVTGDVVIQVGGGWGHVQTWATNAMPILWFTDGNSVLHLLRGIVP